MDDQINTPEVIDKKGIRVGNTVFEDNNIELCPGWNVTLTTDDKKVIISAPNINKTTLKNGPFLLSGEHIVIEAGKNIIISSVHPNKLIIGADISKETLRIVDLEKRVSNLEVALSSLLKRKP